MQCKPNIPGHRAVLSVVCLRQDQRWQAHERLAGPEHLEVAQEKVNFDPNLAEVEKFNAMHLWRKRGVSMLPVE